MDKQCVSAFTNIGFDQALPQTESASTLHFYSFSTDKIYGHITNVDYFVADMLLRSFFHQVVRPFVWLTLTGPLLTCTQKQLSMWNGTINGEHDVLWWTAIGGVDVKITLAVAFCENLLNICIRCRRRELHTKKKATNHVQYAAMKLKFCVCALTGWLSWKGIWRSVSERIEHALWISISKAFYMDSMKIPKTTE